MSASSSAWSFPDRYDAEIKQAAERWLPGYDWRLWKAQLYQESLLNPDAVSPVGARGIAQFMPGTWLEVSRQLGYQNLSPHMAEPAIIAGAYYQGRQVRMWSAPRPDSDRYSLGAASYNAGAGNVLASQRVCGGANGYAEIIACLPRVTGDHATETKTYVQRIWRYWTEMLLGVK
ncbi:transglycosylase SLT domain-containing protein [Marinobacterium lutimaris]|uniref:Transglycosylase SLT domain-containing protein n=1 Tax=Marinobacterium lutimaris TaxID=568106 RepID=A0A1H5XN69_9GAMM|nr:Transglycosylase SLT domain-containing protein [Marinobacterium lutimaris]